MRRSPFLCLVLALVAPAGALAQPDIIHVDPRAGGLNSGESWNNAYTSLHAALLEASLTSGAVEIRVAGGDGVAYTHGAPASSFNIVRPGLVSPLVIRGGYRGVGPGGDADDRDTGAFPTVLDGQDIARHVLTIDANPITVGYAVSLDGFTITRGLANGGNDDGRGGGVLVKSTSDGLISIANCRFEDNFAINGGAIYWAGVSAGLPVTSRPLIDRCAFVANTANVNGGAIDVAVLNLLVQDCEFDDNHALTPTLAKGGAVRLAQMVTLLRCFFRDNSSMDDGGAVFVTHDDALIKDSLFQSNDAADDGGAVAISHGVSYAAAKSVKVAGSFFLDNSAGSGGAVSSLSSAAGGAGTTGVHARIDNCAFFGNTADDGGAIYDQKVVTTILSSLFSGNVATNRGGAYAAVRGNFSGEARRIVNCTFSGNSAAFGGAFALDSASNAHSGLTNPKVWFQNTVFNQNTCPSPTTTDCGGTIFHEREAPTQSGTAQIRIDTSCLDGSEESGALFTPTDSIFEGNAGNGFNGNLLDTDPRLTRPFGFDTVPGTPDDDLTLQFTSDCVDRGDNAPLALYTDVADLDGDGNILDELSLDAARRARRQDTVAPDWPGSSAPVVDIGAYEVPECQPCPGDSIWQFPLSGGFTDVVRWIGGVPDSARNTIFAGAGAYEVHFPANAINRTATIAAGDVHFDLNGRTWTLNAANTTPVVVAALAGDDASASFSAGKVLSGGGVIGRDAGSRGAVSLVEPGARWESSRSLSVGLNGSGELHIGPGASVFSLEGGVGEQPGAAGRVTIDGEDADWSIFSTLTVSRGDVAITNGATLSAGLAVSVFPGGSITGDAHISSDLVQNFGLVRPGTPGSFAPGSLTIDGDYSQIGELPFVGDESGVLAVDIGADPARGAISATSLVVSGEASLAGGLVAAFTDGFVPSPGPIPPLPILDAAVLHDRFDVALLPGLDGGRYFFVHYDEATGTVTLDNAMLGSGVVVDDQDVTVTAGQPAAVATAYINDDEFVDLVLAIPAGPMSAGSVIVLINAGVDSEGQWLGSFTQGAQVTVGFDPSDLAVGDFDGDGLDDVAVALAGAHQVQVLFNDGAGSLDQPGAEDTFDVGFEPRALVAPDLDNDLRADLAVACFASDSVVVLINHNLPLEGMTLFQPAIELAVGDGPRAIASVPMPGALDQSDLDDDGLTDLVTSNLFDDTVTVLSGPGALALRSGAARLDIVAVDIPAGEDPDTILPGDLDEEKDVDLIIAASAPDGSGVISVILNLGALQFAPAVPLPIGDNPRSLALIDLDHDGLDTDLNGLGDGDLDIAAIVDNEAGERVVRILRNDLTAEGHLAFALDPSMDIASANPLFVLAADIDDDASHDLVVINAPETDGLRVGPTLDVTVALNQFCAEDLNGDRQINFFEINLVVGAFNTFQGDGGYVQNADVNRDGAVNFEDLNRILGRFNTACD